jgi:hypothetical protein
MGDTEARRRKKFAADLRGLTLIEKNLTTKDTKEHKGEIRLVESFDGLNGHSINFTRL